MRHCNITVLEREVGQAFGEGAEAAFQDDFMPFDLAVVDVGNADFRKGIVQREACRAAAFYAEALRMIGAETEGPLGVQNAKGEEDG